MESITEQSTQEQTEYNKLKYGIITNWNTIKPDELNKYDYALNNLNIFLNREFNLNIEIVNLNKDYVFFRVINLTTYKTSYIMDISFKELLNLKGIGGYYKAIEISKSLY